MGNPTIPPSEQAEQGEAPFIRKVPGPYIAAGQAQLPTAGPGAGQEMTATVDVPDLGAVRITYKLSSYKHGRGRFWHWVALRAEAAG